MKNINNGFISCPTGSKTKTSMSVYVRLFMASVLFFLGGHLAQAQQAKKDSIKKDTVLKGKIDEVVVTGYKTKKRADINQAQVEITNKQLSEQPNTLTVTNMLEGKAAGVFVQTDNGKPGSEGKVSIRGIGNFEDTPPTFVVDGQFVTEEIFNRLNPAEIESVVIMKDAASAAQYGSKGANGVVVVTTKSGSSKKTVYTFNTIMGSSEKISDRQLNFEMMDARQKLEYENAIAELIGGTKRTPEQIAALTAQGHDWQKDLLRSSFEESYFLSASGGGDKSTFFYSLGYDHNTGIVKHLDDYKRYSARVRFDNKLSEKFKTGILASFSYHKSHGVSNYSRVSNPFYFMYFANPYQPVYNKDGSFNTDQFGSSVIEELLYNPQYYNSTTFYGNIYAEYAILSFLKFRSSFNNTYYINHSDRIIKKGTFADNDNWVKGGTLSLSKAFYYDYTTNNRLDFVKDFGDHHLEATVFHELLKRSDRDLYFLSSGIKNDYLDLTVPHNYTKIEYGGGLKQTLVNTSLAALLDYNYASKYYLSGSVRRDGSSRFGRNNLYGNFWSLSAAWNLNKEKFFPFKNFDEFKLRYSYGVTGNDANASLYRNSDRVFLSSYAAYPVATIIAGNSDLKWESAKMQNIGLNFSYNKRLTGAVEYFFTNREDFIQAVGGSAVQGSPYIFINAGNMQNSGIEAQLSYDVIKSGKFTWNLHGNLSSIKNKVLSLRQFEEDRFIPSYTKLVVGEAPNTYFLVKYAGVDPQTGDALYYKKDGTITNEYSSSDAQMLYGKTPFPNVFGGFGTEVRFGKFDFSAEFTYKFGGWTTNNARRFLVTPEANSGNKMVEAANFWKNPGDTNVLPKPSVAGLLRSDLFLERSDNINFRSLNIGYTFDRSLWKDLVPIQSLRVFFQAQNLMLWTKFKGNPNMATGGTNFSDYAVSNSFYEFNYPISRTFSIGFNVNF